MALRLQGDRILSCELPDCRTALSVGSGKALERALEQDVIRRLSVRGHDDLRRYAWRVLCSLGYLRGRIARPGRRGRISGRERRRYRGSSASDDLLLRGGRVGLSELL